ncbi:MAG: hypothetical protein H7Z16_12825 [Pyrinomonadaceae bacterium]|nr:hypothetical protein [Pyrinomonadaceae bacterium]
MWLVWAVPLVVIVFLWTLNEFLQGRLKAQISGVLAILIFGLCGMAYFLSGWLVGVLALIGSFALAALFRAPALWTARKLVDYPDLGVDDCSRKQVEGLLRDFGSPEYFERFADRKQIDEAHMANTVSRALAQADVQEVLSRRSLTAEDVKAFYERFEISSLPHHLRELAVSNAKMLDYFFENSTATEVDAKYVRNVNDRNVAITLTLWAKHNPAGEGMG